MKKITVISYFDDNFGDMLIKMSFECLLKTALKDRNIDDYETSRMGLKLIDEDLLRESDLICFGGGGLLGMSYLSFFKYVDRIVRIADENGIPVIFSSVGINNMGYEDSDDTLFRELLNRRCIRAISVREQYDWFVRYVERDDLNVKQVCDPALWTAKMYADLEKPANSKPLIGLNCVRSGLMKANDREWTRTQMYDYFDTLISRIKEKGYDYILYTNGSVNDNLMMRAYAESREIPEDKIIAVQSTDELVRTVRKCDFVCAIRLHSTIIATSFGIPVANLVWNDKVPEFYRAVGRLERAIEIDSFDADEYMKLIEDTIGQEQPVSEEYRMSLYSWLFDVIGGIWPDGDTSSEDDSSEDRYTFREICEWLPVFLKENSAIYEVEDYRRKLSKTEKMIYNGKKREKAYRDEIRRLQKENKQFAREIEIAGKLPTYRLISKVRKTRKKRDF